MSLASALVLVLVLALAPAPAGAQTRAPDIAALQVALRAVRAFPPTATVDGVLGPTTQRAVRRFQRRRHLPADGVAGPRTLEALGRRGRPRLGSRALIAGRRGWDVAALQFSLAQHGFPSGTIDGGLGVRTDAALRRFQRWVGLPDDGVAGPGTLTALRRAPARAILRFVRPVAAPVGDRYGPRGVRLHSGVDFPADSGTPVTAAGRGCISQVGYDPGGYGRFVVVRHRLGMTSWYAHLSRIDLPRGRCVLAGTRIGLVGSTGGSTGPHLHFELRLRGATVDPLTGL